MSNSVDVVPVRRRDLRQPAWIGAGPSKRGSKGDPRYPSPTGLRQMLSFLIDLVVHLSIPFAVGYTLYMRQPGFTSGQFILVWAAGFLALSILDRIFVQWATQATIGKAITALRVIRDDTGARPTLWQLVKAWFFGIFAIFVVFS
jgi:uncharacterized RDD family membrane protein YckC